MISELLHIAVEDNVAWCSCICSAHGSNETASARAWANFGISPPFYPNIITRKKGAQQEVDGLIRKVHESNRSRRWGIKDSFAELTLTEQGFDRVLAGHWYGGTVSGSRTACWQKISSLAELRLWEHAWGPQDETIFPGALLDDSRIGFWFKGAPNAIEAGFISFDSGFSLGLSNWFSRGNQSFGQMEILQAAGSVSRGLPIVCWSTDDLAADDGGLSELGPLQVWISQ